MPYVHLPCLYSSEVLSDCSRSWSTLLLTLIALTLDGQGEISNKSRPLKPGEVGEWILLDGVCPIPETSLAHSLTTPAAVDPRNLCQHFIVQPLPW